MEQTEYEDNKRYYERQLRMKHVRVPLIYKSRFDGVWKCKWWDEGSHCHRIEGFPGMIYLEVVEKVCY